VDPDAGIIPNFETWFNDIGGRAKKLKVEYFDGMGNGM
jgi:hypothetical protein